MSDVTCRLIKELLGFLELSDVSTAALRKTLEVRWGPPEGKKKWLASLSRLPWNDFAFFCREIEPFFTPELMRRFVDKTIEGPSDWVDIARPMISIAVTPAHVYSMVNTWMGPWAFRNVRRTSERRDGTVLHVRLELRPEDDECPLFFRFTQIMFEQLPRMSGGVPAHVAMTMTGRSADYAITLPPRLSLWSLVRRRFLALFAPNALFRELAAREQELHGNATKLRETQLVLEEAVRARTAELESTNRQLSDRVATVQRLERFAHLGTWTWHLSEPHHLDWSEETYRLFAIDPKLAPTPELLRERIHPDDLPMVQAAQDKCRLLGLPMECDHRIILPDGTVRWIAERGEVIKDEAGRPLRVIGSALDVTLQKRYEQSLIAAKEAADAANRTKSTFLANVSHEIRTPMSSVLGFAELLTTADLPAEKHSAYVDKILRNGRHLLALIDDVLDLSKIEAGHLIIQPIRFSPQLEVTQALDLLRADADKKALRLTTQWDQDFPAEIQNDPIRFRQIIINIVGNAVKYTERGEVRIACRAAPEHIEVTVDDSGPGISPEFADSLFQPFSQAKPHAQKRSGSGLGLALARQLARALGGDVDLVRSEVGVGTRFEIRIARFLAQDPRQNALLLENGVTIRLDFSNTLAGFPKGAKILIAEDNPDIQDLVRRVLEAAGAQVTTANNGVLALEATKGQRFDLVLMDMQMPELDGFQTTAQLRRDGFRGPIVALTAFAMSGERQKCFAAGCNDFLAKPVESLLLIKTVAKWIKEPVA